MLRAPLGRFRCRCSEGWISYDDTTGFAARRFVRRASDRGFTVRGHHRRVVARPAQHTEDGGDEQEPIDRGRACRRQGRGDSCRRRAERQRHAKRRRYHGRHLHSHLVDDRHELFRCCLRQRSPGDGVLAGPPRESISPAGDPGRAVTTKLQNGSGFTLIELLIATVFSLALGIGGFAFYRSQARSLTDQSAGLDAIEGARAALDFMSADIRMAGANPAGTWSPAANGCFAGVSTAQATSLTIAWDGANGDTTYGTINAGETTRYWYDAGTKTIVRTVNGVDTTLIKNVPTGGL